MNLSDPQRVRPMTREDLGQVLAWRNHPEVRRFMYSQHEISLAEHASWYERASKEEGRHLLVFENSGVPLGFINIHEIAAGGVADWGFYASPDAPKGTGRQLGRSALNYAFTQANLHKLNGQALAFNDRSIKFHLNLGFTQEGILRDQHFDGTTYHDVVCFGIRAAEWPSNN